MSTVATGLRAVSFGTLDGSLWATAVDAPSQAGGRPRPMLVLGGSGAEPGRPIALSWSDRDGDLWELAGDRVALTVAPGVAPVRDSDEGGAGAPDAGGQQLCRVRGTVAWDDGEREIDCVGTRVTSAATTPAPGSARLVAAWFSEAEALTLLAVRPQGAEHHAADAVSATLFDPDGWIVVSDPRLSTTYDEAGLPTRATLELWIGEGDNEFPRRAAGEVSGPQARASGEGLVVQAAPLRCHSRGQDGAGVYVLATF